MRQRQDEALAVLLALPDQEHAAAQTRVVAVTCRQFPQHTADTIVDMNKKKKKKTPVLLTRPPGPASLSAAELLFWTRLHGTTAAIRERLREKRGESVSSRMSTATGLTGHEDLQEGVGPEFKLGRLHLSASRLCARRRDTKPTGNGQNISRHSKRRNLFIAPCWLTAVLLPLNNLPEVSQVIMVVF